MVEETKKRTIADSLNPTFENVTEKFITHTMQDILLNKEKIDFNFIFEQKEAMTFIKEKLKANAEKYDFMKEKVKDLIQAIEQGENRNSNLPALVIKDYKMFFEYLRQYYEKDIELYYERTNSSGFPVYEMENCFEDVWLRATPDDFNNPETFLKKQAQMIKDSTFEKYKEETLVGQSSIFNNHMLCVKNGIARTWDENSREFKAIIYDKEYYERTELFNREHYELPVIRYGIYEENDKKICHIGSIQTKEHSKNKFTRDCEKVRYQLDSKNIREEQEGYHNILTSVEPSHLLALSLFVNLLHKEGIEEIEIPSMYVLDYQYHTKRDPIILKQFNEYWTEKAKERKPEEYEKEKELLEKKLNRQDYISKAKTEILTNTFMRLIYHYPKAEIRSYPNELDTSFHIRIPKVQNKEDINQETLRQMYELVEEMGKDKEVER